MMMNIGPIETQIIPFGSSHRGESNCVLFIVFTWPLHSKGNTSPITWIQTYKLINSLKYARRATPALTRSRQRINYLSLLFEFEMLDSGSKERLGWPETACGVLSRVCGGGGGGVEGM